MYGREDEELNFFKDSRSIAIQKALSKSPQTTGGRADESSILSEAEEKRSKKPEMIVSCSGDAVPLDRKQKEQLLNNFVKRSPPGLFVWLCQHVINQGLTNDFLTEDRGPFFYATIRRDSSGRAQKLYSTVGAWEKESARNLELQRAQTDAQLWQ